MPAPFEEIFGDPDDGVHGVLNENRRCEYRFGYGSGTLAAVVTDEEPDPGAGIRGGARVFEWWWEDREPHYGPATAFSADEDERIEAEVLRLLADRGERIG